MIKANGIAGGIRWLVRGYRHLENITVVGSRDDVPVRLNRELVIVGKSTPKWAILPCPCGCGDRIEVNLMQSRRPVWKVRHDRSSVSLYPSLWRAKGTCESHFWITNSRVEWARAQANYRQKR